MTKPGSLGWFAHHEMRLAWRDALSMMTAGRRDRERRVAVGVVIFVSFMHVVAFLALGRLGRIGIVPSLQTLVYVTAAALLQAPRCCRKRWKASPARSIHAPISS